MKKITIVGAGLSGLTSAIILSKQGFEVEILEKGKGLGGVSLLLEDIGKQTYVFADMTPFDIKSLSEYIGFNLADFSSNTSKEKYYSNLPFARFYSFGRKYDMMHPEDLHMKLIERGPRKSSLDYYLYFKAKESGVNFNFGNSIDTKKDFDSLPPGSIIATGMNINAFKVLGIPHMPVYCFIANGSMKNYNGHELLVYLDKYINDYGYFSMINGIGGALLFQRKNPISKEAKDWFIRKITEDEGVELDNWHYMEAEIATPTGSINNTNLFHNKFILAGTLAGMQDPSMVLGVHGAIVSGKIAALAVTNKEKALKEFKRMNAQRQSAYLLKKLLEKTHPHLLRPFASVWLKLSSSVAIRYLYKFYPAVPGWMKLND